MIYTRPRGFRKEDHEVVVFENKTIQRMFTEYLKEKTGFDKPFEWKIRFGEASYERIRKEFLRKIVYPTDILIVKKPRITRKKK